MDGSGVASSFQCLHYDHPCSLAHVVILIPSSGLCLSWCAEEEEEEEEEVKKADERNKN